MKKHTKISRAILFAGPLPFNHNAASIHPTLFSMVPTYVHSNIHINKVETKLPNKTSSCYLCPRHQLICFFCHSHQLPCAIPVLYAGCNLPYCNPSEACVLVLNTIDLHRQNPKSLSKRARAKASRLLRVSWGRANVADTQWTTDSKLTIDHPPKDHISNKILYRPIPATFQNYRLLAHGTNGHF